MSETNGAEVGKWTPEEDKNYDWFRCEEMSLCQLYLQTESSYQIVSQLGEKGICQFRDLNSKMNAFQRKFVNELRRCVELERKIGFLQKEIEKDNIPLIDYENEPGAPTIKEVTALEAQLEHFENALQDANTNRVSLKRRLLELTELRYILKNAEQFFEEQSQQEQPTNKALRRLSVADPQLMRRFSTQINNLDIQIPLDPVVDMFTLTGTILTTRFGAFERMLWRVSRGNILLKRIDIDEKLEDPETGDLQQKCLFILVFQGEKLQKSCKKICDGFHTTVYPCPDASDERKKLLAGIVNQINDIMTVIRQSDEHRSTILVATAKNLKEWKVSVVKMRSIYETMNMFSYDITDKCLIAECWIPNTRIGQARMALQNGQTMANSAIPSVLSVINQSETPPTYNVSNKFTAGFQVLIDSYGTGTYGEANPAPYAIISFPFIFAVMFGDTGHGVIMSLFALWMVLSEKKLARVNGEIFRMFFGGRYLILLMGLFSIYTGLIYNDTFSKSINLFGSSFLPVPPEHNGTHEVYTKPFYIINPQFVKNFSDGTHYTYYFGMDPAWQLATNKVLYLNTYKMKLSVILGVLQMLFGVILSLFNHIHFKKWINIYTEFIPQVIFLLGIFGYMNFMIFFKWFAYDSTVSGIAPSILITLINMFMFKEAAPTDPDYLKIPMYEGQSIVQKVFIIAAFLCVPWMLIIKPVLLLMRSKRTESESTSDLVEASFESFELKATTNGQNENTDSSDTKKDSTSIEIEEESKKPEPVVEEKGFDFGDTFINQAIHTIEYCLGSISHTASYLRLWALSLAHAELSEVLWNMVLTSGFMRFHEGPPGTGNIPEAIVMYFIFAFWAIITVVILIVMEGLSAFLHALRLHWVEFMSKFYTGMGYPFVPFSFKLILSEM